MSWNYPGCFCLKHITKNVSCKECDDAYRLREYVLSTILNHLTPEEKSKCFSEESWIKLYWDRALIIKNPSCYNQPPTTEQTLAIIKTMENANNEYFEKVKDVLGELCGKIHCRSDK
jgi:hypothetical protein